MLIEVDGDRIASVDARASRAAGRERLDGLTLPGSPTRTRTPSSARCAGAPRRARPTRLAKNTNLKTHHSRPRRVLDLARADVRAAERLDPDSYLALARATFAEMALAGITRVGEFHYLHHGPDGTPYDDPNAMGDALIAGGRARPGIRITLLDACYLHGGIGAGAERGAAALLRRRRRRAGPSASTRSPTRAGARGSAPRSTACARSTRTRRAVVAAWARERGRPLHAHVSEQPAENEACLAAYGRTPDGAARRRRRARRAFTAVHATHLTDDDVGAARRRGRTLLPLPDDRARPRRRHRPGRGAGRRPARRSSLGSDSHAVIDLFEEARAVELDERLASGERGRHSRRASCCARPPRAATPASAGRTPAASSRARCADLVTRRPRLASGSPAPTPSTRARVASCSRRRAADVRHVIVGGDADRARRAPRRRSTSPRELDDAIRAVVAMSTLVVDNIGLLVTNDPELGEGPLGIVERRRAWSSRASAWPPSSAAGAAADERLDAGGPLRDPGLRRQPHAPRVRRRPRRRVRRAHGRPARTRRAGIRVTTEATRAATRRASCARSPRARRAEARARGHHARRDQVRLRARRRDRAARCCERRRRVHRRRHVPRRPRRARRVRGPRRRLRRPRLRRDARRVRAARAAGSTSSARRARSTPTSRARCSRRAATPGSACGCTATSSGPGPGVRLAVELGAASVDHCTYLDRRRRRGARRRATPSPRSSRPPTSRPASPTPTPAARSTPA